MIWSLAFLNGRLVNLSGFGGGFSGIFSKFWDKDVIHDSLIWKCVYEGHHELRHFGEICQGAITNLSGWLVESQLHWEQCHMPTTVFCYKRESISLRRDIFCGGFSQEKHKAKG